MIELDLFKDNRQQSLRNKKIIVLLIYNLVYALYKYKKPTRK
ncbi:hypothetical protein GCW_91197 [Mycoplasmoides gallisepticum S6]|uniref:Uncharacterized protein n=1 Tax=Mycoplasmoides gallisepticum S6 TaxID=1006581 RepID=A0A0F6CLW1_MYCGL|nr:hypothetical protein GCW_91197 [Mycoplasmoides gallisepticum S6]